MLLKIALPKGRLFQESVSLLYQKGVIDELFEEGRKLTVRLKSYEFFLVKPSDVSVYVENGVADVGIVGYDVLMEKKPDVYKLYNLGIGFCRIVVAGLQRDYKKYAEGTYLKVATKYPRITKEFFSEKGIKTKIIYLSGSVELAPIIGLSDCIVDLVQTGRTLKENDLIVYEEIATSNAHLICNRASYRNKRDVVIDFVGKVTDTP